MKSWLNGLQHSDLVKLVTGLGTLLGLLVLIAGALTVRAGHLQSDLDRCQADLLSQARPFVGGGR